MSRSSAMLGSKYVCVFYRLPMYSSVCMTVLRQRRRGERYFSVGSSGVLPSVKKDREVGKHSFRLNKPLHPRVCVAIKSLSGSQNSV